MTAKVNATDTVLEIGPGPGSLTEALLETGARVIAVEKDRVLADALQRLNTPDNRLQVFCEDILTFPLESLAKDKKLKVIANLPYNVTTPILAKLVPLHDLFTSLTLMVQEEVARRFVGTPGTSAYSSFTIFLNYYSTPCYGFKVSHNCFYPPPNVESAIVCLNLHTPPKVSNQEEFFTMTRTSFEHRRKMLRASLKDLYGSENITKGLEACGLNPLARPEDLSLAQFIKLFEQLNNCRQV